MNKNHVKGKLNEIKGKIKEEYGHRTGDSETAAKGVFEQVKGKLQKGVGDLKDAVKNRVDKALDNDKRNSA